MRFSVDNETKDFITINVGNVNVGLGEAQYLLDTYGWSVIDIVSSYAGNQQVTLRKEGTPLNHQVYTSEAS